MRTLFIVASLLAVNTIFAPPGAAQKGLSAAERKVLSAFEDRAEDYVDLREKERRRLPKLSDEATPAQIGAFKTSLQKAVRAARQGAKAGDIFTPEAAAIIRRIIKNEFKGWERNELRKSVLEADTRGVPLAVNAVYPESKELVEMSPALLLALPQLPKQLRYRFVGRSLVILDRDNALIVDFMRDALP
jgi:hypothetical protein